MNEYRVLLVDDEPHVVEGIAVLLEDIESYSIDIYRAYSARDALRLLDAGRMDLVITDIEMQEMNGLALQEEIHRRWPDCPVAFLTAHSNFSYAYQAFQNRAANYILKTESDESLVEKIVHMLDQISREDRLHTNQLNSGAARAHEESLQMARILSEHGREKLRTRLKKIGFDPRSAAFCLLLCAAPQQNDRVRSQAILELLRYHIQKRFRHLHGMVGADKEIVYLVQLPGENRRQELRALFGILEACQRSCEATFDIPISIIMQPFDMDSCLPCDAWSRANDEHARIQDISKSILFARGLADEPETPIGLPPDGPADDPGVIANTVDWICRYIDENITGDVSLLKLSTLTGYNAQYLSGVFHQKTGRTLSRYVATKRLDKVTQLLADPEIPIQEVAKLAGFSSRSYFNRFIKQETYLTPQQLRTKLLPPPTKIDTDSSI